MQDDYIHINIICKHYNIQPSWITEVSELGLVHIHTIEPDDYLHRDSLARLEKVINLHEELGINFAGIEVIFNLLQKIENLQNQINSHKEHINRLEY